MKVNSVIGKKIFEGRHKGVDVFENKLEKELEHEYLDKFYDHMDDSTAYLPFNIVMLRSLLELKSCELEDSVED
ncbi:hypothetical protein L1987_85059 [Smallanthus sonchifolius]|uniref:Uncharacterized protein n=1 Tax=Smallanthus sonchifolius TaxID=185202 RepID=A0ACB8XX22_9ASTR|nr:hypothetical protein L1987_85059 [Smallanthus sonchifolius]